MQGQPEASRVKSEGRPFLVGTATILAIIVFYYVIVDPAFRSARTAARTANEVEYVKQAALAVDMYAGDHDDRFPSFSGDMESTLRPYIRDRKLLDELKFFVWNDRLSGKRVGDIDQPNDQVVVFSAVPNTDSIAVGTVGGLAFRVRTEALPEIVAHANNLTPMPFP